MSKLSALPRTVSVRHMVVSLSRAMKHYIADNRKKQRFTTQELGVIPNLVSLPIVVKHVHHQAHEQEHHKNLQTLRYYSLVQNPSHSCSFSLLIQHTKQC